MSEADKIDKHAKKLLNEWVNSWNGYETYEKFYAEEGRLRMNLEAFAFFIARKELKKTSSSQRKQNKEETT